MNASHSPALKARHHVRAADLAVQHVLVHDRAHSRRVAAVQDGLPLHPCCHLLVDFLPGVSRSGAGDQGASVSLGLQETIDH
jgi:hypothetical protein